MKKIEIHRSIHIEQPTILEEATVGSASYISSKENILLESVMYGGQREFHFRSRGITDSGYRQPNSVIRKSTDNGRTWTGVETLNPFLRLEGNRRRLTYPPTFILKPGTSTILRLCPSNEDIEGVLPWDPKSPAPVTGRSWTQLSRDGGQTWSPSAPVVFHGPEFDEVHWAPETWFGKNNGWIDGASPVWLDDRRFILPFISTLSESKDGLDRGHGRSAFALGTWRQDGSGVDWELSAYATVKRPYSNCGGDEPSVARLPDGRIMMTMRVRVDPNDGTSFPSGKFYTVTDDLGQSWSEPLPFRYTDGEQVYCPASMSNLFYYPGNGNLYLITNFLDKPTFGCDPRTTLQIAQLDIDTLRVIRDSITVIETRRPDQPETIRFSNWWRYEDRETHNPILLMTACPGNVGRHETCAVPPHCYRYDIILPDGS
jgi:hypothetical protein